MSDAPWHQDADFKGRFHPEHVDDLQVILHDGEPRRTQRPPEVCWVTVQRLHGTLRSPSLPAGAQPPVRVASATWSERKVYAGKLLNAPHALATARQGDTILFVHAPGLPHALRVTEAYLGERAQWGFTPCNQCGTDQALDPPTVMAKTRFPDAPAGAVPVMFSAICPCQGVMMLAAIEDAPKSAPAAAEGRPWWKFW